jgi:hypothetical protein
MSKFKMPDGREIELAMWLTKILRTTAPGRLVVPGKAGGDDWMWMINGVTVPPFADYEPAGRRPTRWRSKSTDGEVVIRVEAAPGHDSGPCFQADTLALVDADERFAAHADQHHVPQLAALWAHFEEVLAGLVGHEPGRAGEDEGIAWQTWQAKMAAFTDAMRAAAGMWAHYTQSVVGTMAFPVRANAGSTIIIERRGADGTPLRDEIPVVLYMLEKRPVP